MSTEMTSNPRSSVATPSITLIYEPPTLTPLGAWNVVTLAYSVGFNSFPPGNQAFPNQPQDY